jgi:hypothetical protein
MAANKKRRGAKIEDEATLVKMRRLNEARSKDGRFYGILIPATILTIGGIGYVIYKMMTWK